MGILLSSHEISLTNCLAKWSLIKQMSSAEEVTSIKSFEKRRSLMSGTAYGETFHWYRTK